MLKRRKHLTTTNQKRPGEILLAILSGKEYRKLKYKTKRQGKPVFINDLTTFGPDRLRPIFVQEKELVSLGWIMMH